MKIATWNVNSIRARRDRVLAWLDAHGPEVLCLQETKVVDDDFPAAELTERGYRHACYGQASYNGVAIVSRMPLEDVQLGFCDDGEEDPQARVIAATIAGLRIISVYVPNGQSVGSDKYQYKLAWMARLRRYLDRHDPGGDLVLCGDFNVAPEDRDCYDPAGWQGRVLCSEPERAALARIVDWGLVDTVRLHHDESGLYSWWDYRMLAFQKRRGLRIDHVYCSRRLAERCSDAFIDRDARKGKLPSDHAPVVAVFQ